MSVKCKELSDAKVESITKKFMVFQYIFLKTYKVFKAYICWVAICDLLKLCLLQSFIIKYCVEFSLIVFGTAKKKGNKIKGNV